MARAFVDASGQYLDLGETARAAFPTGAYSIALWYRRDGTSDHNILVNRTTAGASSNIQWLCQPGINSLAFRSPASGATTTTVPALGVWTHLGFTFDPAGAGSVIAYVNGVNVSSATGTTTFTPGTGGVYYIANSPFSEFADQANAEYGVWNVALTDDEMAALAKGFTPPLVRPTALQQYVPITGRGSAEPDLRLGTTATLVNSPAATDGPAILRPRALQVGRAVSYTLAAESGTFDITGQPATLQRARRLVAGAGSLQIIGQPATLYRGYTLPASAGDLSLDGGAATLRVGRRIAAEGGSLVLTGSEANLNVGGNKRLTAEPGALSLAGGDAALRVTRRLAADGGALLIAGQDAILRCGRVVPADSGALAIDGQPATLTHVRHLVLVAEGGSLVIRGPNVRFGLNDRTIYAPPVGQQTATAQPVGGRTATAQPRPRRTATAQPLGH